MPGLYVRDTGGVARKYRELHEAQGGVDRKLREMHARDTQGVSRRVFAGAIKWTCEEYEPEYAHVLENDANTVYITSEEGKSATGGFKYLFTEPLLLQAGTLIKADMYGEAGGNDYYYVYLDYGSYGSAVIAYKMDGSSPHSITYTVPDDLTVSYITGKININGTHGIKLTRYMDVKVTLPDGTAFTLTSVGTSM